MPIDNDELAFGLEWDRDYFVAFAKIFRECFWPPSVFIIHPFTIFVLIRKTAMTLDCKSGYVVHHIFLMCFDYYNGALYQMYPLAPIPVFICTGSLCQGAAEGTTLLTGLAFCTISLCIPYLFIMLRMHQKMLFQDSPLKVNKKTQALILLILSSLLVANVFGFHYWAVDTPSKQYVLQNPEVVWATNLSTSFLVLGENEGDVGSFGYELILLIVSIFTIFSFYIFITYDAVHQIGRQLDRKNSRIREAQIRFVYSLTIQACCSAVLFILPMLFLFIGLVIIRVRWLFPGWLVAPSRLLILLAYNSCSIAHSIVFLSKNPWFIEPKKKVSARWEISENREKDDHVLLVLCLQQVATLRGELFRISRSSRIIFHPNPRMNLEHAYVSYYRLAHRLGKENVIQYVSVRTI